jgi:hypothetical protein
LIWVDFSGSPRCEEGDNTEKNATCSGNQRFGYAQFSRSSQDLNVDPNPGCESNADLDADLDPGLPTTDFCDNKDEYINIFHLLIEQE